MNYLLLILCLILTLQAKPAIEEKDFSRIFNNRPGTIVVYDASADSYIVHNRKRSTTRFTPFSTFKIANSIVALETGVIKNVDTEFTWDTTRYPAEDWWPEQWRGTHTMRTAIKYSVVPFYREIASRVGEKRMKSFIDRFDYGNRDISSGEDDFWLNGSLSISAMEQIAFLRKFHDNKLGIKKETTAAVEEILIREKNDRYTLSAKTGGGSGFDAEHPERALGWYAGYITKGAKIWYFAMNIEGESFEAILQPRRDITNAVLTSLGIIE